MAQMARPGVRPYGVQAGGRDAAYQGYQILHIGFTVFPILAGLDKFFRLLVDWDRYLSPFALRLLGEHSHTFMLGVGVVEMAAGLLVALKPKIGGYVVALWLWAIIANLLMAPGYFDIALRDFGLSLGALALARLAAAREQQEDAQPAAGWEEEAG